MREMDCNNLCHQAQDQCQRYLSMDCELYLNLKWASVYSEHRLNIRRQIYKKTKDKTVLDLNSIPYLRKGFVSISHCPVVGGFGYSNQKIGFDLEQYQRLSPGLISRISSPEEDDLLEPFCRPSLWTIKESVYKLYGIHEGLMSQVKILDFKVISNKELEGDAITVSLASAIYKDISFQIVSLIDPKQDVILSISRKIN